MRRCSLLLLLTLAACAAPKTKARYSDAYDPGTYHRIGVLPFSDRRGRGRQITQAVAEGLPARGFVVVDASSLSGVLSQFRPDAEMGLGITELTEIKQATNAQALLTGSVDPEGRAAKVVMIETELGDELVSADIFPRHKGPFKNTKEIVDQILDVFGELPKHGK